MIRDDPNLEMLQLAAAGLGSLLEDVVFLGGCAAGLLITDSAVAPTRETKDVDVIVEIASRHDLEDLIAVLDGRDAIVDEVEQSGDLCRYLSKEFGKLLSIEEFLDAVRCHLPGDAASQQRVKIVLQRMHAIRDIAIKG